jgi:hypothetical protein
MILLKRSPIVKLSLRHYTNSYMDIMAIERPTEYVESGAYDPSMVAKKRMLEKLNELENKVKELSENSASKGISYESSL